MAAKSKPTINEILKLLAPLHGEPALAARPDDPLVDHLMVMVLGLYTTPEDARAAVRSLFDGGLDFNEIRVSGLFDIETLIKSYVPKDVLREAAYAVRMALQDVWDNSHGLDLEPIRGRTPEDARGFLKHLPNIPGGPAALVFQLASGDKYLALGPREQHFMDRVGILPRAKTPDRIRKAVERKVKPADRARFTWVIGASAHLCETEEDFDPKHPVGKLLLRIGAKELKVREQERKRREKEDERLRKIEEKERIKREREEERLRKKEEAARQKRLAAERREAAIAKKKAAAKKKAEMLKKKQAAAKKKAVMLKKKQAAAKKKAAVLKKQKAAAAKKKAAMLKKKKVAAAKKKAAMLKKKKAATKKRASAKKKTARTAKRSKARKTTKRRTVKKKTVKRKAAKKKTVKRKTTKRRAVKKKTVKRKGAKKKTIKRKAAKKKTVKRKAAKKKTAKRKAAKKKKTSRRRK